ncbi:thioredoxin domain-containing protein [Acidiphilium acidophilum]|uniref:Thioredoxin domain-containing protein n=1 Tax=Acidiphilium acidophilum TaxID=76588 RepID=A0AAW9DV03_ACIAO|nr:thioredoxin domain-containing protein [Acidiphilium acidophilum]MDX5932908.1 thioredoxin domain-containing protein [Acidiphilium acidophilum]
MTSNTLATATSPYLLQHADNPVHWHIWRPETLEMARLADKPILLSIGYAACHWCHVMAHESFEDAETAALMNARYVSIKIDREERPDLDSIYMSTLQAMGEQGGWPLTMILTPDGAPIFGGTYFPPEPRWGRPSFRQVLTGVAEAWANEREKLLVSGATLMRRVMAHSEPGAPGQLVPGDLDTVAERFIGMVDWDDGGLRGAPKFPNPPIFRFLWGEYARTGRHEAGAAVALMLARMAQGGIYDHLGGGFARYSTDAAWLVPHFEKMLYDNAQILELLAFAHAAEPDLLLEARAAETVGWLVRDMRAKHDPAPDGNMAFAASEDADSEGVEGKFYVWTRDEIMAVLGDDFGRFEAHYPCPAAGNWEERIILTRATHPEREDEERDLAALRARLFEVRAQRVRPGWDDKILADWNGLTIAALVRASAVFERPDWLDLAIAAFEAVTALLGRPDGRFDHAYRRGAVSAAGLLDDQAAMLRAMIALYEATGIQTYLDRSERLAASTAVHFGDGTGGLYAAADDARDLPGGMRPRAAMDNAVPAAAGLMAEIYARLYHLTGTPKYRDAAQRLINAHAGERRNLPAYPTFLGAAALLDGATSVVITGDPLDPRFAALHRAALGGFDPAVVVLPVGMSAALPEAHPAYGKGGDAPAAFVCRDNVCGLPVSEPAALREAMIRAPVD